MHEHDASSLAPFPEIEPPLSFPFCLVWTHIPVISWLFPMIGHVGICDSKGTIYDFAGSQYVNTGKLSYGSPLRYWRLNPADAAALVTGSETTDLRALEEPWDEAIIEAKRLFQQYKYNFWCQNCHSFAACLLSRIHYGGSSQWGIVQVAASVYCFARYVDTLALFKTWGPCTAILIMTGVFLSWEIAVLHGIILCLGSGFLHFKTVSITKDKLAMYRAATV